MPLAEFEAASEVSGRFRDSYYHQVHAWTKEEVQLAEGPGATSRLG